MGADTKALRNRIKSVNSTLHLTNAMGLVASSKIRRANEAMFKGRDYAASLEVILRRLTACKECHKSPFFRKSASNRTRLVVIAGDRGLAGGYNANIFRALRDYPDAEIIPIGKRICDRYDAKTVSSEKFSAADAFEMAQQLCKDFREGAYDRLGIVSTQYVSVMSQEVLVKWVLPLSDEKSEGTASILFEPDEATILQTAVPEYIAGYIAMSVRESFACEVAARRMAMDSAGKNALQMIDDLQIKYNRARQGAITQEITEIVAGSGQ